MFVCGRMSVKCVRNLGFYLLLLHGSQFVLALLVGGHFAMVPSILSQNFCGAHRLAMAKEKCFRA